VKNKITYLLKNKLLQQCLGYLFIILVVTVFVRYWRNNPSILNGLKQMSFGVILIVLVLYFVFLGTNLLLTKASVSIFNIHLGDYELLLLTIYSTLVNFFGPLQSGPGYRAIYLKSKYKIKIKDYTIASIVYYISFALISLMMLVSGIPLLFFACFILSFFVVIAINRRGSVFGFTSNYINKVITITLVQLVIVAMIYSIELSILGYRPSLTAALIYTGSANLALFVAFTPAAIGIRESFILLSQSMHGIPSKQIIAASIIDRSIYFLFLIILFSLSSGLHIKQKLGSIKGRSV